MTTTTLSEYLEKLKIWRDLARRDLTHYDRQHLNIPRKKAYFEGQYRIYDRIIDDVEAMLKEQQEG